MPKVTVEHEQQQRQKILRAAVGCFCQRGYHNTSVQHICDEAGLSKGGLYTYFKSKEQILAAVVKESFIGGLEQAIETAGAGATALDKLDRVATLVIERLSTDDLHAVSSPQLFLEIWAAASKNPRLRALCVEGYDRWKAFLTDLLREGQAHRQIKRDVDPRALAAVLVAAFDGLSMQENLTRTRVDWQRIMQTLRQALGEGILTAEGIQTGGGTPAR